MLEKVEEEPGVSDEAKQDRESARFLFSVNALAIVQHA